MAHERRDAGFESDGTRCAAWLYRPEGVATPPVVVMAHGFGGTRRMRLPAFAEHFAERGLAVLLFDYRGFGDSDGEPRDLVDPTRHVADWLAAVDHARSLEAIDRARIGVWGTSFSGGHALVTAARTDVAAYVGQVPYFGDAPSPIDRGWVDGPGPVLRALGAGLRDEFRARTGRPPLYVPIVGQPGELAVLTAPGAEAGYRSIVPDGMTDWNRCAARIFLRVGRYEPRAEADAVDCPAFVFQATRDRLVSADAIDDVVETLDRVERVHEDCGHFDPYTGAVFSDVVEREADFLVRHLREA